jgi:type I restriction enzyme R subunit
MVFFAQKILRTIPGNWTFVVVTDRVELDDQTAKTFKRTGAVSETESENCHATGGAHLRELLRGNHRCVFTLIQKFQTTEVLCDRPDVIVLTDEAHRSQYDTLAVNMRAALPKALFVAFTGTPMIAGEERTREVFGGYVSIYDLQQSVEDHATVRLYYENRTPELRLENPGVNDDIYALVEAAGLDEEQEQRLERELDRPAADPGRPAGNYREGHRPALPRPGVSGQGHGRVPRQGHGAPYVQQSPEPLAR